VSIAIDIVEGEPEDITYLNAKAVIIEATAEIKDDTNGHLPDRCMFDMLERMR
jgi:hypothetical protein